MSAATAPRRRTGGWEAATLRALMYPANIVLGGVVAFLLALPLVTALPVAVALGRSLSTWHVESDDAVVTNLLRELRATWRRTWRLGVAVGIALFLLAADVLFLLSRLGTPSEGLAVVVGGATLPVACVVVLAALLVPVAAARDRQGDVRAWLTDALGIATGTPARTAAIFLLTCGIVATCIALPTLAPFVLMSLPLDLAVRAWPALPAAGGAGTGTSGDGE
ncbi:hypothetical protein UQW22_04745 [Isoptericola halotolerans]|uniref:hypothetical protein n=1 Tax=Isoptericola halotolerans TaxID=300560 RepID=UPI0038906AFA